MGTEKRNVLALRGKYCKDCIIYTEDVDDNAIEIVGALLGNPLFRDAKIRVMPDVHAGIGGGNHFMEYDEGGDGVAHLHRG